MIIGLVGYAQAGKDEAARALVEQGFTKVAFADPLREMLLALNPVIDARPSFAGRDVNLLRYRDYLDACGYESAKAHPEVRRLLQRLGTEAGRQVLGEDVWVNAWVERATWHQCVVTTDVRFDNEVNAVRSLGGIIVRVDRPGTGPANDHASETLPARVKPNLVISNNGTVEDLHAAVLQACLQGAP